MASKVLVTGANGFVGSYIIEELIKNNYLAYAGVRRTSNTKNLKNPQVNFFYYSFEEEEKLREQLIQNNFDYIILNAGITQAKNKETYFKVNAGYTRKLLKILVEERLNPKKVIFISSLASYGPADYQVKQTLDYESIPHPVTWYGESKLQAENFIKTFKSLDHIIFRPTAVYGPRSTEMLPLYKMANKGLSIKIGKGEMTASFIYVEDLARLIVKSLSSKVRDKSYFVSDGNTYPIHQFNETVASLLNKKVKKITLPFSIVKAAASIMELIQNITGKAMVLNRNKAKEYYARSFEVDTTMLEYHFRFKPKYTLEQGLSKTLKWCKKENHL